MMEADFLAWYSLPNIANFKCCCAIYFVISIIILTFAKVIILIE